MSASSSKSSKNVSSHNFEKKGISSQGHPTTSQTQFIDQGAGDKHHLDISIPAQTSTTLRPQSVEHSLRNEVEGNSGERRSVEDRDAQRMEARGSRPGISIASPTIDHPPMEVRNEDVHGISIPIEMPLITPEQPSIHRGGRDLQIAIRCFEIMNKHLKYNILGLGDPARFMSNKDSLKEDGITDEQLQEKIPQQLRYACLYWVNHLEVANTEDNDLMNEFEKFANEHMLHWFEVLSLIENLDLAHRAFRALLRFLLLKSTPSYLYQLLSDGLRFISKFYEVIERSALHMYYSALPFTATDSLLYRRYIKEAGHSICSIEGGPEKWGAIVANPSHEGPADVVKFSLDSTLFVSLSEKSVGGFHQGKLKISDAVTGTPISTIPGHRFAVADNFSTIASSKDNTITFYNVNGSARGTMFTTLSKIEKLALSSESSRIAAALSDGTVWLWDSRNAGLIDCFDGFKDSFWSQLQISPTGTRLVYSSASGIVKLRDGISGRFIADLQCGSEYDLYFAFSNGGSRIASLSVGHGLKLWNSKSGGLIGVVMDVALDALAISANGSLLATAELHKVRLWIEHRDYSLAQVEVLEVEAQRSMVFSLDNILAIATFSGVKLYNVNTRTFMSTLLFRGEPTALAFSPDCTRLAIGVSEGGVCLWDVQGIDTFSPSSKRTAGPVIALALSRDCSRLACGFEDGTVELWDTSSTKRRLIASHQAHKRFVRALEIVPDGRLFASGSDEGTIKLWNGGDGSLRETLKVPGELQAVAVSNSVLVATWDSSVTLWSLDTLSFIHTFEMSSDIVSTVSIAENSTLVAVAFRDRVDSEDSEVSSGSQSVVFLLDVVNHMVIATFKVPFRCIHTMTFLPDNSQLVVRSDDDVFLSLNLITKYITEGPTFGHLIQLPDTPLCHGVPVWHCEDKEQHFLVALFSQDKGPVPVLWIPRDLPVCRWTQKSSMIALGCDDGHIILLRLPTSHAG